MNRSASIASLAAALVKAQPEFDTASKDATNPFFKSKYADLSAVWDAVQDTLAKHGLTVSQFPDHIEGSPALTTVLVHESGEWMEATYPLVVTEKERTPQGFGSALTYARRYGLSAVLGVVADEDDDANHASGRNRSAAPEKPAEAKAASPAPAPKAAVPSNMPPSKISPAQWALDQISVIRKSNYEELGAWEKKNEKAMAILRADHESLWEDIRDNLIARKDAIGTP